MSVAFRRESDEEHLEPKFERPIPPGPNLVTERGLAMLAEQAEGAAARLAEAAPEARAEIKRDLRYWRARLATAQLAPTPPNGDAGIGSRVRFRLNGHERLIAIVGSDEADPDGGKIAFSSPLARALLGTAAGDLAAFGGRDDAIEILAVD